MPAIFAYAEDISLKFKKGGESNMKFQTEQIFLKSHLEGIQRHFSATELKQLS